MNKNIPFEIIRYDTEGNINREIIVPKEKAKHKSNSKLKNALLISTLLTTGVIGSYLLFNPQNNPHPPLFSKSKTNTSKKDTIAIATYNGKTYFFPSEDSFMINLSKKTDYFDLKKLSVNKESLDTTLQITKQMNLPQLIATASLSGMHDLYTNYADGKVNFESALKKLWIAKTLKMHGKFPLLGIRWSSSYNQDKTPKTNFPSFKSKIKTELDAILTEFDYAEFYKKHNTPPEDTSKPETQRGHPEKQRFFENYFTHLNENTITAYGITELFSAETNPALNIVFLDNILQNAGEEFINKIPAMFDEYLSFGFFQLTSNVINKDGAPYLNMYLPENLGIPKKMRKYDSTEEQIRGAILVNIYNAEILANTLFNANELTNFNNKFEKLTKEQQETFIAGYTSAAHHASSSAASAVVEYQKEHQKKTNSKKQSFSNIIPDLPLETTLKQYYTQSLKNYLVLKEMDKQFP